MNTLLRLGPATKFTLLLTFPLTAFLLGAYKVLMALAVSSESIKYLPSNLVYAPDIIIALAILIGSTVLSVGLARVMFSFSRYVEVRVGYTQLSNQLATSHAEDHSIRSVPELPKPVVVRSLDHSTDEHLLATRRDTDAGSEHRHQAATQYARAAGFRAARRQSIGHIDLGDGLPLPGEDEPLLASARRSQLFEVRE